LKGFQGSEGAHERALVAVLIAHHEVEELRIDRGGVEESPLLEADGAVFEPMELGEVVHEGGFGHAGGLEVGFESVDEGFESFVFLAVDENLVGGEAVFEGVPAGNGLAPPAWSARWICFCYFSLGLPGYTVAERVQAGWVKWFVLLGESDVNGKKVARQDRQERQGKLGMWRVCTKLGLGF
jgi:hypothetical protein